MKINYFLKRQHIQIKNEGLIRFSVRKSFYLGRLLKYLLSHFPFYVLAFPIVIIIRMLTPFLLIRINSVSWRIGPLASDIELYFCGRDAGINVPDFKNYVDFFYLQSYLYPNKKKYNKQLYKMWKRSLTFFPELILDPIRIVNRFLPGWKKYEISDNQPYERDVHNLYTRYPTHLKFIQEEEERGINEMKNLGIPQNAPFVCLLVRNNIYEKEILNVQPVFSYRNADIDDYILGVRELVKRGYYVVRMGVKADKPIRIKHPMIIDYAYDGSRSDFMDIFLASRCAFCITTSSGWDSVAVIFRKPIVYTNFVPLELIISYANNTLTIAKRYTNIKTGESFSLKEIVKTVFTRPPSETELFEQGIAFVNNSPEEIRDVVVEMMDRLDNSWQSSEDDEKLQKMFWDQFPKDATDYFGRPLHGKIYSRYGAKYLRDNQKWLE